MKEHPAIKMPLDSLGHLCERLPAGVRDPHAHNASLSTVGDHALALRGCESGLDQFDHHVHREPVRTQDRLGVTVTAPGKQFEGAAAVGLGDRPDGRRARYPGADRPLWIISPRGAFSPAPGCNTL